MIDEKRVAINRLELFEELKRKRKVALRLGELASHKKWVIKPRVTEELLKGKKSLKDLTDTDIQLDLQQKGVDIKDWNRYCPSCI